MAGADGYPRPNARRLRIYSFDPALAAQYDLAGMSSVTIDVRWEENLKPGPVGEYVEVIDVDPGSQVAYAPIDLNAPELLATDGLAPSESDPRFHQQMCYAVAMKTIEHFERALGRKALWSSHLHKAGGNRYHENYVPRLRIYPHALRQQNAFYSPRKKALLFGYFPARAKDGTNAPGATVFACLSHDIIAHETTHALLDGVHPRFNEPVNEDVLAFHEAFADIVALFQHFSYPGVLRDQIARTRGDLARQSVLGQLAQQFALASGRGAALRSYLGDFDREGKWQAKKPNPALIDATSEPHDRGAILVAAVFGAFAKVYQARTRDLYRIATEGTGVLPEGDIHPDLVNRLADEAQRCSERALQICIRAIDYCPPVGITFGDYLRAIVTADYDLYPADPMRWRLAFIESFREWGISPRGGAPRRARAMAEDSLLWPTEEDVVEAQVKKEVAERRIERNGAAKSADAAPTASRDFVESAKERSRYAMTRIFQQAAPAEADERYSQKTARAAARLAPDRKAQPLRPTPLSMDRFRTWVENDLQGAMFHSWLLDESWSWLADALGLILEVGDKKTISANDRFPDRANIEIHAVRTAMKRGALEFPEPHMIVEVTQSRAGFLDPAKQRAMDQTPRAYRGPAVDFKYRAGCTLLIDPEKMKIRRVIRTPGTVADDDELNRMRRYLTLGLAPPDAFQGVTSLLRGTAEPFAFLHAQGGE